MDVIFELSKMVILLGVLWLLIKELDNDNFSI